MEKDADFQGLLGENMAAQPFFPQYGVDVEESELIGLMPRKALEMAAAGLLKLHDFHSERVIETRLESALIG